MLNLIGRTAESTALGPDCAGTSTQEVAVAWHSSQTIRQAAAEWVELRSAETDPDHDVSHSKQQSVRYRHSIYARPMWSNGGLSRLMSPANHTSGESTTVADCAVSSAAVAAPMTCRGGHTIDQAAQPRQCVQPGPRLASSDT